MTKQQSNPKHKFAVCVSNEGCDDLRVWQLYKVLRDADAESEEYLRVVDESGEDYLYPASRFVIAKFAPSVEKRLLEAAISA